MREKSVICDLVEAHPLLRMPPPIATKIMQATAHMVFTIPPCSNRFFEAKTFKIIPAFPATPATPG
jgi:hypothetical protein